MNLKFFGPGNWSEAGGINTASTVMPENNDPGDVVNIDNWRAFGIIKRQYKSSWIKF